MATLLWRLSNVLQRTGNPTTVYSQHVSLCSGRNAQDCSAVAHPQVQPVPGRVRPVPGTVLAVVPGVLRGRGTGHLQQEVLPGKGGHCHQVVVHNVYANPNRQRTLYKLSTELYKLVPKRAKMCLHCVRISTELPFCIPPLVVGNIYGTYCICRVMLAHVDCGVTF